MTQFDQFQHEEYSHIAKAHFSTSDSISAFFRYYLLVMSLPLSVAGALLFIIARAPEGKGPLPIPTSLLATVLIAVGFVGVLIMAYIISLRIDLILYARKVNSIRKYFYDRADLDMVSATQLRFLPQTHHHPRYFEALNFLPVIFAFSIINSLYFLFGITAIQSLNIYLDLLIFVSLVASHFGIYYFYTQQSENTYLRTSHIGVDVDGVLNLHREHFCELANSKFKTSLLPEQITRYPVQDSPDIGITESQVKEIFRDPLYWSNMPVSDGAARNIQRLRNALQLKVHIFTHRPAPTFDHQSLDNKKRWRDVAASMVQHQFPYAMFPSKLTRFHRFLGLRDPIQIITTMWLWKNGIEYDSLTIETGSENVPDASIAYKNRFRLAAKRKIRYFVEDDWEKATKLAYICDVVFLVDHPYNQQQGANQRKHKDAFIHGELPANVVRVSSWDEIYRWVRQLN